MAGSMSRADLVADLKASLLDAARLFAAPADGDFIRLINTAANDLTRRGSGVRMGTITLQAGVAEYAAPAGMQRMQDQFWYVPEKLPNPWETTYPGSMPRVRLLPGSTGPVMLFAPAPSALHIMALGDAFAFTYAAEAVVGELDTDTSIDPAQRQLLILRAQAEAMRELAMRNVITPVQMRDGVSGTPSNMTPAAFYAQLMDEYLRQVAA